MPLTMIRAMAHTPCTGPEESDGFPSAVAAIDSFKNAMRTVHTEQRQLRDGDHILPIMIAPEWCFRKTGSCFQYNEVYEIIEALREASRSYPDTLIIPGTIHWSMPGNEYVTTREKTLFHKAKGFYKKYSTVYNTAVVINDGKLIHINHKQWKGHDLVGTSDDHFFGFQPGAAQRDFGSNEFRQAWNQKIKAVDQNGSGIKSVLSSYFEYEDLKFGVEICADHTSNILAKELSNTKRVDVQILISCGAAIVPKALATCDGGWVIHADGRWVKDDWQRARGLTCVQVPRYDSTTGRGVTEPDVIKAKNEAYRAAGKTFLGTGQAMGRHLERATHTAKATLQGLPGPTRALHAGSAAGYAFVIS